jgi:hypothetical protein
MKFCTLAIATTLLAQKAKVNSQMVTNGNFAYIGSYSFPRDLGYELGGGSIVGDTLYLVVNSEEEDSYIASVPIQRHRKCCCCSHCDSHIYIMTIL